MFKRDVVVKKIYLCAGRTDMRRGIDGLVSIVRLNYGVDPLEKGTLFLFCGLKKDRIKALVYEGDGWTLMYKKLTSGRYCWPSDVGIAFNLSWDDYDRLMDGFTIESTIKIK